MFKTTIDGLSVTVKPKTRIKPGFSLPYDVLNKMLGNRAPKEANTCIDYSDIEFYPADDSAAGECFQYTFSVLDRHPLNSGAGPDFYGILELKSRALEANSAITVGTMQAKYIATTSWTNTHLYEKTQVWLLVSWTRNTGKVKEVRYLDLRAAHIQQYFEDIYDICREQVIIEMNKKKINSKHDLPKYIRPVKNMPGYMELVKGSDSYQFRISSANFDKLVGAALTIDAPELISHK